ncbi:hypothetical protein CSUI_003706 [Cystoisospora suis]|uniref:Uncharacterized protein n=1 Tax=Cystoisospora suis TaxID=483139 RepID=A0A2C6L3V0_9APIC|nr:hypothetical protein CSUI_003706 [Cystoisospora suis]
MEDRRKHARSALNRVRARISTLAAFRRAAENYEIMNNKFFGYDNASFRQDSLRRQISGPPIRDPDNITQMTAEEQAFTHKKAGKKYISRGLLAEPAPFKCNSRGVTVRAGGHGLNEYARIKIADLRSAYALSLLEADMNHYRHLYWEAERKKQVQGRLKFFTAPSKKVAVPGLWLEDHAAIVEHIPQPPPDALEIERELSALPALRQAFGLMRKHQLEKLPRRRAAPTPAPAAASGDASAGKVPAAALPGKGAAAALKANAEKKIAEASQPPLTGAKPDAAPGKPGAPPPPPGGKGLPPGGKGVPPGKGPPKGGKEQGSPTGSAATGGGGTTTAAESPPTAKGPPKGPPTAGKSSAAPKGKPPPGKGKLPPPPKK